MLDYKSVADGIESRSLKTKQWMDVKTRREK